ncbi:ABC transporter six-transmembrane domain-containing protein [Edwardsiella tarda]
MRPLKYFSPLSLEATAGKSHDAADSRSSCRAWCPPRGLARHYQILARLRVAISDRESLTYLIVGIGAALRFLLAIVLLSRQPQIAAVRFMPS